MKTLEPKDETHPRFSRMLQLIKQLTGNTTLTICELAGKYRTTERTIYRYIDTFINAGFFVRKVRAAVYQLVSMDHKIPDFEKIVYFNEEEARLLSRLIEDLDNTNRLKGGLYRKLACIYQLVKVTDFVGGKSNSYNIAELGHAMESHRQVILHGYCSSHSETTTDRYVEPFAFTTNHITVWAYDCNDGECKQFGISRIGEAEVLNLPWEHEKEHRIHEADIFHMTGDNPVRVVLQMSCKAKNLLLEEFPLAEKDMKPEGEQWILTTYVRNMKGVGRFVIGLADAISIVEGEELKAYVRSFSEQYISRMIS